VLELWQRTWLDADAAAVPYATQSR
jgi:hypothetical protein